MNYGVLTGRLELNVVNTEGGVLVNKVSEISLHSESESLLIFKNSLVMRLEIPSNIKIYYYYAKEGLGLPI